MSYRTRKNFNVPAKLLKPVYIKKSGVEVKEYPKNGDLIFCSFKTYGGTERTVNDLYVIEDTANVETWYRPDIKSDCAIMLENGNIYEIINEPENVEMRNIHMIFKVRRIKGGA